MFHLKVSSGSRIMELKLLTLIVFISSSVSASRKLPNGFLLGAGTSAYQTEGAWNEDGKGESLWDHFLHSQDAAENGDIACDSYHKWEEDVANAKALGLNFYRFSVAWTRILPNGTLNKINQKGIDYYMHLINALLDAGIEPMITIYHWDMPEHISQLGGFLNPQFVDYFEDYARLLYKIYGPYVKYWFTLNEPAMICQSGYGKTTYAPALNLIGDGTYQCSYILLKAHARAYRIYENEFKSKYNGQVGLVINFDWAEPVFNSSKDLEAQVRYIEFTLGLYANPIYLGNWPQIMIDRIANRSKLEGLSRSRLPQFTQQEIDYINGTHDFFALNTYNVLQIRNTGEPPIGIPSYQSDKAADEFLNPSFYHPEGMRDSINHIYKKYQPKGIIITENGKQTDDGLNDQARINEVHDLLGNVIDAVRKDGINVFGYSIWSLLDNFEWGSYNKKFGIIHVDFNSPNRTRTWKKSAKWYQQVISTRILDIN